VVLSPLSCDALLYSMASESWVGQLHDPNSMLLLNCDEKAEGGEDSDKYRSSMAATAGSPLAAAICASSAAIISSSLAAACGFSLAAATSSVGL